MNAQVYDRPTANLTLATMNPTKVYHYLFYKFYKFYDVDSIWLGAKWWTDWKASFSVLVLEIWLLLSFLNYYEIFTEKDVSSYSKNIISLATLLILVITKYIVFEHRDRWKEYIKEFDKWPKRKNKIGTIFVSILVLFILANLIYSFYLLSQINWRK